MSTDPLPTLSEITSWLSQIGEDRDWLADQLHVSKGAVNGWFSPASNRPIAPPTHKLIKMLMRTTELGEPKFTYPESIRIQEAMRSAHYHSFAEFARDAVMEKVRGLTKPEDQ